MKLYDISMTVTESVQVWYNGDSKRPKVENVSNFSTGGAYVSRLSLELHTGTHVDAPAHMIDGGAMMESYSLEQFVGPARVLDLTHVKGSIGREHLEPFAPQRDEWILLKTSSSFSEQFDPQFPFVRTDGAQYLRDAGIRGVGTDALGIERDQPDLSTHRTLLGSGIIIAEGLRLKEVPAGSYFLVIAPVKLAGVEAAPARALLIEGMPQAGASLT